MSLIESSIWIVTIMWTGPGKIGPRTITFGLSRSTCILYLSTGQ